MSLKLFVVLVPLLQHPQSKSWSRGVRLPVYSFSTCCPSAKSGNGGAGSDRSTTPRDTSAPHQSDIRMLECWNSRNAMLNAEVTRSAPYFFTTDCSLQSNPTISSRFQRNLGAQLAAYHPALYFSREYGWDENETQIFLTLTRFLLDFRNIFGFESALNFTDCSYTLNLHYNSQLCFLLFMFLFNCPFSMTWLTSSSSDLRSTSMPSMRMRAASSNFSHLTYFTISPLWSTSAHRDTNVYI